MLQLRFQALEELGLAITEFNVSLTALLVCNVLVRPIRAESRIKGSLKLELGLEAFNLLLKILRVVLNSIIMALEGQDLVPDHIHRDKNLFLILGYTQTINLSVTQGRRIVSPILDFSVLDKDGYTILI